MRIVCWQMNLMKYHSLFLSKIRENVVNLSSAAVVIGALGFKYQFAPVVQEEMSF